MNPAVLRQQDREWEAWRQICKHLARIGVDINANEPLACAIRLWGEELANLRKLAPQHHLDALTLRRAEYDEHKIDDGAA